MAKRKGETQTGQSAPKELKAVEPSRALTVPGGTREMAVAYKDPIAVVKEQMQLIKTLYSDVLVKDVHYGVIEGTKKPTLYKPGAEKITTMFQLVPKFDVTETVFPNGHLKVDVKCMLYAKGGETLLGDGVGSCTTLESKYRYRNQSRKCPACGQESIIKGKEEYGGGWLCWKKKGGCGAKFDDGATAIESQNVGKIDNPDIADVYNTVLKMAKKRAYVDATLTVSGVSEIFTQDVEDFAGGHTPPVDVDAEWEYAEQQTSKKTAETEGAVSQGRKTAAKQEEAPKKTEPHSLVLARRSAQKELSELHDYLKVIAKETGDACMTKAELIKDVFDSITTFDLSGKTIETLDEQEYWAVKTVAKMKMGK